MDICDIITEEDLGEPYDRMVEFLTFPEILSVQQTYSGRQLRFRRDCLDVNDEYPELVALIGTVKAKVFIKEMGGMNVYYPELKRSCFDKIRKLIASEFNGYNLTELAKKFGYTERHIRRIVAGKFRGRRVWVDENQLSLYDFAGE